MKGKKKDIKFLAKRYPPVIKDSSFKVTEQSQEKVIMNMVKLSLQSYPTICFTYLFTIRNRHPKPLNPTNAEKQSV